jgi:ppGpp synthetase/RelA/SpoT-type nucleotidyltranferase
MDPTSSLGDREEARAVINNWRSSHSFPLNTVQVNLRNRANKVDPEVLIAQRIKRLPSIEQKLNRFSGMRLSRMQDIGGCRAVVADLESVDRVVAAFRESRSLHELIREDDYAARPQESGYRSHHLVYRYLSETKETYNGLAIEVQVRLGFNMPGQQQLRRSERSPVNL